MGNSKRISACNQAGACGLFLALVNAFLMLGAPQASAALGDVDPSFITGPGVNGSVERMAWQADGKVLVAGSFTQVKGLARTNLARLNADGSGDPSFEVSVVPDYVPFAPYNSIRSMAVQTNGQIIIAGSFTNVNGQARNGLARLNADGSLDSAYNPGPGPLNDTRLQTDGRLLIGSATGTVARLNSNGSTDTSFNSGVPVTGGLGGLFPNGQVLIKSACAPYYTCFSRRNADGSVDATFSATVASGTIETLEIQPDGKVIRMGATIVDRDDVRSYMMRLNNDGTLDDSFSPSSLPNRGNWIERSVVYDCAILPDGRILVCGSTAILEDADDNEIEYYRGFLVRLDANGGEDPGFARITAGSPAHTVLAQPDGKVLLGGSFQFVNHDTRQSIARFQTNGLLDHAFAPDYGPTYPVSSILLQPDGKIIVSGGFESGGEDPFDFHSRVDRLNADGSLDATFTASNETATFHRPIALHPDGRLIAYVYSETDDAEFEGLAFLEYDGTVDFDSLVPVEDVQSIAFQPDGKMLIAGRFDEVNGVPRKGVARLNTDGTVDSTFVSGASNNYATSLVLQPDGKVLIGLGPNTPFLDQHGLVRLNADGSLDTTFNPGTGIDQEAWRTIAAMALQTNGQVLIAGNFTNYNDVTRTGLARLHANGSLDLGFNPVIWGDEYLTNFRMLHSVLVQPDGRILITGIFTNVNGVSRPGVARLNPDGSLDSAFSPSQVPAARCLALQPDGKVLVGGSYSSAYGSPSVNLVRLLGQPANEVSLGPLSMVGGVPGFDIRSVIPRTVAVESSTNLMDWSVVQSIPLSNAPVRFDAPNPRALPTLFYRLSW